MSIERCQLDRANHSSVNSISTAEPAKVINSCPLPNLGRISSKSRYSPNLINSYTSSKSILTTQRSMQECIERRAHAATPQRQRSDWSKFKVPTIMTMRQPSEQTDCGSPQLSAECTDSPSVMDSMMELLASPFECLNSARRSLLVAPCKIEGAQKLWMRLELHMPLQVLVDGAGNGRPGWLRRALRMEIAGVLGIELHQVRGESSRVHARDRSVRVCACVRARIYAFGRIRSRGGCIWVCVGRTRGACQSRKQQLRLQVPCTHSHIRTSVCSLLGGGPRDAG